MFWGSHHGERRLLPRFSGSTRLGGQNLSQSSRGARRDEPSSRLRKDVLVQELYLFGDPETTKIGEGSFSEVLTVQHKQSGHILACKRMQLPSPADPMHALLKAEILKEIDILCSLNHENILSLKEYFVQDNQVFLIMEFVPGGNLMSVLQDRDCLSETDARVIFVQILRGIEHMHVRNIAHRDLKLDNILLCRTIPGDFSHLKIGDFGLAKRVDTRDLCTTVCGTPLYVAPEVVSLHNSPGTSPYGIMVDMWGAGVILYMLLAGYPPFDADNHPELFSKVLAGQFNFDAPVWDQISSEAKDLIVRMLVTDPKHRLSASQALLHPWFRCFYQQPHHQMPQASLPVRTPIRQAIGKDIGASVKKALKRPMAAFDTSNTGSSLGTRENSKHRRSDD